MLLSGLFTLALAGLAVADTTSRKSKNCARELQNIAYGPQTYWKTYLQKISLEIADIAEIFQTQVGQSKLAKFADKYGLIVNVVDAYGNFYLYDYEAEAFLPTTDRENVFSSRDAQSVMNLGAFCNENEAQVYSFLSFDHFGQVYEVTVGRPTPDPVS